MSKSAWLTVWALLLVANVARFVHLAADFPPGLTTSRALYTDEGVYSANAVGLSAGRSWYTPGELNAMVNLPVAPVLQAVVFRIFGTNLMVARSLVAAMSIVLIGAAFLLTMKYAPPVPAALVAITLSLDFLLFSYSRLAIFDVIMTSIVMLAFVTASSFRANHVARAAGLAGALLGIAALAKTTALCALPALAYLCGSRVADTRRQRQLAGLALATCVLVWAGYNTAAWYAYPLDYVHFHQIAETRLAASPLDLARNLVVAVFNTVRFDPWVALTAFGLTGALFTSSATFRANVLVRTSAVWMLAFFVMLSITSYQPSRYFVLVLIPMVMLLGVAIIHVGDLFPLGRFAATVRVALVGSLLVHNAIRIADYLVHPHYSFVRMADEVSELVNGSTSQRPTVLLGTMAASVSLERPIAAISPEYGTRDLEARITAHCPTHFITLQAPGEDEERALSSFYMIESIREWNVFDNYYEHRPVRLSKLHPRVGRLPGCPR